MAHRSRITNFAAWRLPAVTGRWSPLGFFSGPPAPGFFTALQTGSARWPLRVPHASPQSPRCPPLKACCDPVAHRCSPPVRRRWSPVRPPLAAGSVVLVVCFRGRQDNHGRTCRYKNSVGEKSHSSSTSNALFALGVAPALQKQAGGEEVWRKSLRRSTSTALAAL